jgi:hypothetical protein
MQQERLVEARLLLTLPSSTAFRAKGGRMEFLGRESLKIRPATIGSPVVLED